MIKKLRVTVDGNTYDVTVELPDDAAAPALAVGPLPVSAAPPSPTLPPPPLPVAPVAPSVIGEAPGDVPSPLAGRVTALAVNVGQDVKEGDHLLTLEAMKMNTFVFAPKAGKVVELKTSVGAAVEEGQPLVRIE